MKTGQVELDARMKVLYMSSPLMREKRVSEERKRVRNYKLREFLAPFIIILNNSSITSTHA